MRLNKNHEIVGFIGDVRDENGCTKITFSVQKEIEIPRDAIPQEKLQALVGQRVGILNLDGEYLIKKIKKGSAGGKR